MAEQNIAVRHVELIHIDSRIKNAMDNTIAEYRSATGDIIDAVVDHWKDISALSGKERNNYLEHLIHKTKDNPEPAYPNFDRDHYKLPSNIRRAAAQSALGHVQSHQTRCEEYEEARENVVSEGKHWKKMSPLFNFRPDVCPVLYKKHVFEMNGHRVMLKLKVRNDWKWVEVEMCRQDYKSLLKAMETGGLKNPSLVYQYHKYYLIFPVKFPSVDFPKTDLATRTMLGTDLGMRNGAVCSLCHGTGEISERLFDPFRQERKEIDHLVNKIRKVQRQSGTGQSLSRLYTKLQGVKENYAKQLARWIVNQAKMLGAYGIVLEHLSSIHKGKKKKGLRARVHHWCVARIRKYVHAMALREGIRTFLINPFGTSAYAYDGSGKVERDEDNYSMCTFANGKRYNCDLSASYNISARYFIREYKKSTSEKKWSEFMAKVPELSKRTGWTWAAWRKLCAV